MKTILATFAALLTFSVGVAGTFKVKKIKTAGYDRIMASGDFTVRLVAGTEGEITVEGNRADVNNLVVRTEGDILRIYPDKNFRDWGGDMKSLTVTVPVETLKEIVLAGAGKIGAETALTLKADTFKAQLQGNGQIAVAIESNEIEALLNGNGKIRLSGSTGRLSANVSGDGVLQAYALQSATTEATIVGAGTSEVNSSETLRAQVAGSGHINYTGNPKNEQKTIIGDGLIAARQ